MLGSNNLYPFGLFFDKDGAGGGGDGKPAEGDPKPAEDQQQEVLEFATWHDQQPDNIKVLLESHVAGLKSALGTEREGRAAAEKSLRDLAKKLDKDSDARKSVESMADELSLANNKSDFFEAAHDAGVTNLSLAFFIAEKQELFDKRGRVNFEGMKKDFPELFGKGKPAPKGGAGDGTDAQPQTKQDMNTFIRTQAGRG
jgi:hypothetical protein